MIWWILVNPDYLHQNCAQSCHNSHAKNGRKYSIMSMMRFSLIMWWLALWLNISIDEHSNSRGYTQSKTINILSNKCDHTTVHTLESCHEYKLTEVWTYAINTNANKTAIYIKSLECSMLRSASLFRYRQVFNSMLQICNCSLWLSTLSI